MPPAKGLALCQRQKRELVQRLYGARLYSLKAFTTLRLQLSTKSSNSAVASSVGSAFKAIRCQKSVRSWPVNPYFVANLCARLAIKKLLWLVVCKRNASYYINLACFEQNKTPRRNARFCRKEVHELDVQYPKVIYTITYKIANFIVLLDILA